MNAEICRGVTHVFQIERRDGIGISVNGRFHDQLVVRMGAGRAPMEIENDRHAHACQGIEKLLHFPFGCSGPVQVLSAPQNRVVFQQQRGRQQEAKPAVEGIQQQLP